MGAIASTIVAFLWMQALAPQPITEFERARDLLSARDCYELGKCALMGPPSTTFQTHQGAVWTEILVAVGLLGGREVAALNAVSLCLALGVGTVFAVTWRWIKPSLALPSAVFALAYLDPIRMEGELVNPSTEFLPGALAWAALLVFALSGRFSALLWAAIFVAHTANTHTGGLCLVPALVAFAAVAGPLSLLVTLLLTASSLWITSPAAVAWNLRESTLPLAFLSAGLAATALGARFIAPLFRRLGLAGRAAAVTLAMVAPLVAFLLRRQLPGVDKGGHAWLYWPPVLAPLAVAAAAGIAWGAEQFVRRLPRLAASPVFLPMAAAAAGGLVGFNALDSSFALFAVGRLYPGSGPRFLEQLRPVLSPTSAVLVALIVFVIVFLALRSQVSLVPLLSLVVGVLCLLGQSRFWSYVRDEPGKMEWTFETSRLVEERLASGGWTYTRMSRGLQAMDFDNLQLGIMTTAPRDPVDAATFDPRKQMRVWLDKRPGRPRPANAEVVSARYAPFDVVFSELDSWLDPWHGEVCVSPVGSQERTCRPTPATSPDLRLEPFAFSNRPAEGVQPPAYRMNGPTQVSYVIPAGPAAAGTIRHFASTSRQWSFAQATGFDVDRPLPAKQVKLTSRGGPGRIVLVQDTPLDPERCADKTERPAVVACAGRLQLPVVFESTPDNPSWMSAPIPGTEPSP